MQDEQKKRQAEIRVILDDDLRMRLQTALTYDQLPKGTFFRLIAAGYVENNKHIRNYIEEVLEKQEKYKHKDKRRKKDREIVNQTVSDFALDENDIQNIFDIIESENSDE